MVSLKQVQRFALIHPDRSFVVHNGYSGWSYGTPLDPVVVALSDVAYLIRFASLDAKGTAGLQETLVGPIQYASKGDHLFKRTHGNRFVQLVKLSECMFSPGRSVGTPVSFGLYPDVPGEE